MAQKTICPPPVGPPPGAAGSWLVEGIGEDFVPSVVDLGLVSAAYSVGDGEAFGAARELLRREGVLAGGSAGALLAAGEEGAGGRPACM